MRLPRSARIGIFPTLSDIKKVSIYISSPLLLPPQLPLNHTPPTTPLPPHPLTPPPSSPYSSPHHHYSPSYLHSYFPSPLLTPHYVYLEHSNTCIRICARIHVYAYAYKYTSRPWATPTMPRPRPGEYIYIYRHICISVAIFAQAISAKWQQHNLYERR